MRELKFRAWDKETITWCSRVDWDYDKGFIGITSVKDPDGKYIGEYPTTNIIVEQYTGLKDKNGEEIYEGDIIQEEVDTGDDLLDGIHEYTVVWNKDFLCWGLEGSGFKNDLYEVNRTVKVIGNIHDVRSN